MFEHGPFKDCAKCGEAASLGVLSVGGTVLTRRCQKCRHRQLEPLPRLSKKVVYLDQLAFSEIFKVKSGIRRASAPGKAFWERANKAVERVVLLQQAVFPISNIHSDETTVYSRSVELRHACELIGGDISFKSAPEIEADQFFAFADSFQKGGGVPALTFDVDDVLEDERNEWLPGLHITTNMDFSIFADELRQARTSGSDALTDLAKKWAQNKATFEAQVRIELQGWGRTLTKTYVEVNNQRRQAIVDGDIETMMRTGLHRVNVLIRQLMTKFRVDGASVAPQDRQAWVDFMTWEGLEQLPYHRTSAYLFAALARRYANGQKRMPSPGMLNDFTAIATYAPYVDAMFLDRECASLLAEEPLRSELPIKGPIFSVATGDEFIAYLDDMADKAPDEVKACAAELYGIA